ncbi:hypothetical protein COLO4_04348 [Corchorus olitorius]|uniref:Uncharacterized protein n=1 Tax=Corchorus olitorius TaxID=93759 RepID=A0A1R3KUD0_9ROSI|nr:hypothetical protein COLO4_04348 [Corchorus olitorius]
MSCSDSTDHTVEEILATGGSQVGGERSIEDRGSEMGKRTWMIPKESLLMKRVVMIQKKSTKVIHFQAGAGNDAAYHYYKSSSETGLCRGTNGFKIVDCKSGDWAFYLRDNGKVAFFYRLAFEYGLRLPCHLFIIEDCKYYGVAPSQFVPNTWNIHFLCGDLYIQGLDTPWCRSSAFFSNCRKGLEGGTPLRLAGGTSINLRALKLTGSGSQISLAWRLVRGPNGSSLFSGLTPAPDGYDGMPVMDMGIGGPLAIDGIRMIVNTRGEEGREFMMNKSKEDYVDYVVYNLINGKLELEPNVDPPMASLELIEEELDPGKGFVAHVALGKRSRRSARGEGRSSTLLIASSMLTVLSQRMLQPYRFSLMKKDKNLMELMDDNLLVLTKKEFRALQLSVGKHRKAKEEAQKHHGQLEKKMGELHKKYTDFEKQHNTLTADYAALKTLKDQDAGTFALFKIQVEKAAEYEEKEAGRAAAVANATDIAEDLANEAKAELLKSIKEAHP